MSEHMHDRPEVYCPACVEFGAARVARDAVWQLQRVINHWSAVPADVLAEREGELFDLSACRDRIAALAPPSDESMTP